MSTEAAPDINNAPYPADFNPPPGAPVPTSEDFAARQGANVAQAPAPPADPTNWVPWVIAAGGLLAVGGAAYTAYRAAQALTPYALAYKAPGLLPVYSAYQRGDKAAVKQHVLQAVQEAGMRQRAPGR